MTKLEFLRELRKGLSRLPKKGIEERLSFYSEMIDDRMEEGLSEEDAVCAVGDVNDIISQITAEAMLTKEKVKSKRKLNVWEIVLLILGSPVWLSLLIAAFAVILSLYVALWAVVVSLWAVFICLVGCVLGGIVSGIVLSLNGSVMQGVALIGVSLVCAGLSIFAFYGCKAATKGTVLLTKKIIIWIKNRFFKKEEA